MDEPFWVESSSGAGRLALDWKPRPGSWRAVVMNADGTRGVTARLQLGARTSLLWWVGALLLGWGVVAAAGAAALYRRARGRADAARRGGRGRRCLRLAYRGALRW